MGCGFRKRRWLSWCKYNNIKNAEFETINKHDFIYIFWGNWKQNWKQRKPYCVPIQVKLWIVNNELYRHIEFPGWRLRWQWQNDEVIWNMIGAETTEQGNCSRFKGKLLPHCCDKEPVIVDLMPGTPYNKQFANCCRGGVLSSVLQHPVNSMAGFQMHIATANGSAPTMPLNFDLGVPGYTCGEPLKVPPTKFFEDQRRRSTQALGKLINCIWSSILITIYSLASEDFEV